MTLLLAVFATLLVAISLPDSCNAFIKTKNCFSRIQFNYNKDLNTDETQSSTQTSTLLNGWKFNKGVASLADLGCIGDRGEFYYHPTKKARVVIPKENLMIDKTTGQMRQVAGKSKVVPIFPYSSILIPTGAEWLNIFEMKHRMLLSDVNDMPDEGGLFGFSYYSASQQKIALIGTLAKVTNRKLLDDGRVFVTVEGVKKFYIEEFTAENPYLKARVRLLNDYTEFQDSSELDALEEAVFTELRTNMNLMTHIFPSKNYKVSEKILRYRPSSISSRIGDRVVKMTTEAQEMARREKFSYAVLDMLQVSSSTKLR
jgi:Lon protease-like protein